MTGKIGRPARTDRAAAWESVRDRLRARGLRWTPQRRALVDVLSRTDGHITGSELVERCRVVDPATIPSTVYRTLDVLEDLGYVRHHHGVDGREEFHVLPAEDHGHFHCQVCGTSWEISPEEGAAIAELMERRRSFHVDPSHVTIAGECAACRGALPGREAASS